MRDWLVAGAVIEGPEGLLLVQNRRRNGSHDWSPPGGVIDEGETVLDGLTREVHEETGLTVTAWEGPIYEIEVLAPELGWRLRVESFRALDYGGDLVVDDPDGIVVDARFVATEHCALHLGGSSQWVAEPLSEWLDAPWIGLRSFGYDVAGGDLASLSVTRRPALG
jgi:8-oxo-dGTP diphosphatase